MVYGMVKDLNQPDPRFENVTIIREFPNVFLEELTELPPNREVEFIIDFVLGTKPISIPPYQMALIELKEVKV